MQQKEGRAQAPGPYRRSPALRMEVEQGSRHPTARPAFSNQPQTARKKSLHAAPACTVRDHLPLRHCHCQAASPRPAAPSLQRRLLPRPAMWLACSGSYEYVHTRGGVVERGRTLLGAREVVFRPHRTSIVHACMQARTPTGTGQAGAIPLDRLCIAHAGSPTYSTTPTCERASA